MEQAIEYIVGSANWVFRKATSEQYAGGILSQLVTDDGADGTEVNCVVRLVVEKRWLYERCPLADLVQDAAGGGSRDQKQIGGRDPFGTAVRFLPVSPMMQ